VTTLFWNQASTSGVAAEWNDPDVQGFQRVYQENLDPIYRYVLSWVGNREDAEDLASRVFLKAVSAVDCNYPPLMIRRWLFQTARTTLADHWREHYHLPTYSLEELVERDREESAGEELTASRSSAVDRVERLFQALPVRHREVLTCRFLLNLSIRDTALRLGLSEANVKVVQFRALRRAADLECSVLG